MNSTTLLLWLFHTVNHDLLLTALVLAFFMCGMAAVSILVFCIHLGVSSGLAVTRLTILLLTHLSNI